METLWAPWRSRYIEEGAPEECIFCGPESGEADAERYILYRTSLSFVVLNHYPYTNGHLLVVPRRHVNELALLSREEIADLFSTVALCTSILKIGISAEACNVGMNLGLTAGAGVEAHIHVHVVPRWHGDTNFMTVTAGTRVIPQTLEETWRKLLPLFRQESREAP